MECDLCILNFNTRLERNEHTKQHFKQKNCTFCEKNLIRIGDEWYELRPHAEDCYNASRELNNVTDFPEHHIKIEESQLSVTEDHWPSVELDNTIGGCDDFRSLADRSVTENDCDYESKTETKEKFEEIAVQYVLDKAINDQTSTETNGNEPFDVNGTSSTKTTRQQNAIDMYQCKFCKKFYSSKKSLRRHVSSLHGEKKYNCNFCERSFGTKDNCDRHIQSQHLDKYGATCDICNKQFRHKVYVAKHIMTVHMKAEKLKCNICDKWFATHKTLKNHKDNIHSIHDGGNSFKCEVCNKMFAKLRFLNSHKRRHFNAFEYICNFCGRGFYSKHNLENHINVHTGNRPYPCNECGKSFKQYGVLRTHLLTHKNIKPFKCKEAGCEKAYSHGTDLKRHRYSVHGLCEKEFICTLCSKVYAENKSLKKHMESHNAL